MQDRFLRNVSANTFQLIINQCFGLLIFYALSKGLDKNIFGQVNWSLAVLLMAFGILSLGIDQVMVKKIASGQAHQPIFSAYLFHVIFTGLLFYFLLILLYGFFPKVVSGQGLLLIIAVGKLMIFFSTPFKQLAIGLEKFRPLFYMMIVSNVIRGTALLIVSFTDTMSVTNVLIIFIAGDLAELLLSIIIGRTFFEKSLKIRWERSIHFSLIKESLPQAGVVVFSSVMGRFDWILIGLLVSNIKLGEYSFAYKMFELSTLPLLIIAPILIPLFTRLLKPVSPGGLTEGDPAFLLEWQVIIASFIALLLNVCWVPVIDAITDGKYGSVNSKTIFILSLSMPLLYLNNYLWTINFALGKLKQVFIVMAVAFGVNVVACIILIPVFHNEGAAFAYLLQVVGQSAFYLRITKFSMRYRLLMWPVIAFISVLLAHNFLKNVMAGIVVPAFIYLIAVFLSKQIRKKDWKLLQTLYE